MVVVFFEILLFDGYDGCPSNFGLPNRIRRLLMVSVQPMPQGESLVHSWT
jgi:hypothetical protein